MRSHTCQHHAEITQSHEVTEFPVSVKDSSKLEWKNTITINVFGYENKQFYPIYVSKEHNEDVLNLLLITKDEKKHYALIKDSNGLMFNKTKHKERKYFCMHCLQCFSSKDILSNHNINCMVINGEQVIRMPEKGKNKLKFQNHHKQMPLPFIIYADFEAITGKIQGCQHNTTNHILNHTKNILARMSSILRKPMSVIFATRHILIEISGSGITVILQVVIEDRRTKIVI